MKTDDMPELHAAATSTAGRSIVIARGDAHHSLRRVAAMAQGAAGALPEAWRTYGNVDEARLAAREMMPDRRVLRLASVEGRPARQFIEWIRS